jgi:deoxyribonuclease-4
MRIGAHMSAAGGVVRAAERAVLHGCEALQLFTKNNARWAGKPIDADEAARFRAIVDAADLRPAVSHASYLINLAAPAGALRDRSIDALVDELERAALLGLSGVVIHPGVAASEMSDEAALALVTQAIRAGFARAPAGPQLLLEHTAGQGRSIGHTFEHLAMVLEHLDGSDRVGVCLDTCHLLASGYDIASAEGYAATFATFERTIGFNRLHIIHANDSKRAIGSRVDRHEHIGKGHVGLDAFRRVITDGRLVHLAMVIETMKTPGICDNPRAAIRDPLDEMNLGALRGLRGLEASGSS